MSYSKYGEWRLYQDWFVQIGSKIICNVSARDNEKERLANGQLIAAAPDLLEALKGVVRIADRNTREFGDARAAINKAEGKPYCRLDTDGDGNCPMHPKGCPPQTLSADQEFTIVPNLLKKTPPWIEYGPGWFVRVVGDGTDKSHYHIVRVMEDPGCLDEELTLCPRSETSRRNLPKIKRNGGTVWRYRREARADKKSRTWKTNDNSWAEQQRHDADSTYY